MVVGFEYRGIPSAGTTLDWTRVRQAVDEVADIAIVGPSPHGVAFVLRSVERDRSRWAEDGMLELVVEPSPAEDSSRPAELYLLFHTGTHPDVVEALERALAAYGHRVAFESL